MKQVLMSVITHSTRMNSVGSVVHSTTRMNSVGSVVCCEANINLYVFFNFALLTLKRRRSSSLQSHAVRVLRQVLLPAPHSSISTLVHILQASVC